MDAKYVREHVGDALARACVLVAQFQPDDPIEWIACFLRHDAKQQAISQARKQEALDREKLLEEVEQEEERLAKQKNEEERLAEIRRPNEHQNECLDYLSKMDEREVELKKLHPERADFGAHFLADTSTELSKLALSPEAVNLQDEPPDAVLRSIRAGLYLCGYAPSKVASWSDIKQIVLQEYSLRRYETYELLGSVNDEHLLRATKEIDGIDPRARALQKHPLGPLATRFFTYIKSAISAMNKDTDAFFESKTINEDGEIVDRQFWKYPEDRESDVFGNLPSTSHDDNGLKLCNLEGLNHAQLPVEFVTQPIHIIMAWRQDFGVDCDVDASLIMFDQHGKVCDSVYHLMHRSVDGAIEHLGDHTSEDAHQTDTGAMEDSEEFSCELSKLDQNVSVIALVLNAATDGESLGPVQDCSLHITAAEDASDVSTKWIEIDFTARRINGHEILLGLLYRDREDPMNWHVVGIGELVQGPEREAIESQNFMNACPLAKYYIRALEILDSAALSSKEGQAIREFNPFKMVPGDIFQVPALAVEAPTVIGMGWDVDEDIAMDLDCGLAVYSSGQRVDYCDFEKMETNDSACRHTGDNRDGEGEGDDEQIIVEFNKLDPQSDTLFLYAAVYEGGALKDVENVHIRMVSQRGGKLKEICRFSLDWLANVQDDTAVILAKITHKEGGAFEFATIGATAHGRTIEELELKLVKYL